MISDHAYFMELALEHARAAARRGSLPAAAVIVRDGAIIGEGRNTVLADIDPSAHAEVAAIRQACTSLNTVDLSGATLYSTLEPCPMCFWCVLEARIARLVLGGRYAGIGRTDVGRYTVESFLHFTGRKLEIVTGVLARECEGLRLEWLRAQVAK